MGSRLEKNSTDVRKRIENHQFHDEDGEEYESSKFGGFTDYMRRKKIKLQNLDAELRSQASDKPAIFRSIVAHVNGYTQPSLSDLHKLIVSHGGGFLQYLDGKTAVTHVIASNLTPKKKVEFARYRIVKPAWVVDSISAGRLLPWENYRAVDEGVTQKVLGFQDGQIVSQANAQRHTYKEQTETSWYTPQMRELANDLDSKAFDDIDAFIDDIDGLDLPLSADTQQKVDTRISEDPSKRPTDLNGVAEKELNFEDDQFDRNIAEKDDDLDGQPAFGRKLIERPFDSPGVGRTDDLEISSKPDSESNGGVPSISSVKMQLTAEEHNAILLSNPHLAKSSTANPDFLNQYYRESRLHHLSTWKADLKAQLQARALEKSSSQTNRQKKPPGARRYIMHVDFDSFFAAVSLRDKPDLADKPVVIAHGSGPGSEIASCNYPARAFGVKNGMWMKSALRLCSTLNVLPYDFKTYEEASRQFYDAILAMDGIVQSISIDEALVDISLQCFQAGLHGRNHVSDKSLISQEQEKAEDLALTLRKLVKEKTGCEVSVGIGGNILLAKVALRKAKPAGQHLIKPEEVLEFIGELTVTDLPGVAYSIGGKLEEIGIKYVKDIRNITKERLTNALGPKTAEKLWDYSRGIDKVEVGDQVLRKSVSAEINWGIRFVTQQQAEEFVQCLCDELHKRLLEQLVKGKQLTMKIMRKAADAGMDPPKSLGHGKCDTFNKSVILGVPTNDKEVLGKEAISILRGYGFSPGELRGLGVQMQKLEPLRSITTAASPTVDSSQRRLQFKKPDNTYTPVRPATVKATFIETRRPSSPQTPRRLKDGVDPIEEVPTPEKPRHSNTITGPLDQGGTNNKNEPSCKPLNISGTQFLLPSQIDPTVLAALPSDIRSRLAPKQKSIMDSIRRPLSPVANTEVKSRSASPYPSDHDTFLPNQSQLDPDILNALPEDVRREVLAQYSTTSKIALPNQRSQQVLPQSPVKARPISISKKLALTPTKKQKKIMRPTKTRSKKNMGGDSTLTQSNFIGLAKTNSQPGEDEEPRISQSFLDELPEDIRAEILTEQKRSRIAKSGLKVNTLKKKGKTSGADFVPWGQRSVKLPPRDAIPTFTSQKLSTLSELRGAMSAWVEEFSVDSEDGPFEEDVEALIKHLGRVVTEELDMQKAVSIVEWVVYLVNGRSISDESLQKSWNGVLDRLRNGVQKAVVERGLSPVDFQNG